MTNFDSPWKEVLDVYFEAFILFCFPELHAQVDWRHGRRALDKELQQIAVEGEIGLRIVDKLVEVRLRSGEVRWLLIHVEVQSQPNVSFTRRMFVYFYRIFDKYTKPLVSLAILGDDDSDWRPKTFSDVESISSFRL